MVSWFIFIIRFVLRCVNIFTKIHLFFIFSLFLHVLHCATIIYIDLRTTICYNVLTNKKVLWKEQKLMENTHSWTCDNEIGTTLPQYANSQGITYEAVRRQVIKYQDTELRGHIQIRNKTKYLDDFAVEFLNEHRRPQAQIDSDANNIAEQLKKPTNFSLSRIIFPILPRMPSHRKTMLPPHLHQRKHHPKQTPSP